MKIRILFTHPFLSCSCLSFPASSKPDISSIAISRKEIAKFSPVSSISFPDENWHTSASDSWFVINWAIASQIALSSSTTAIFISNQTFLIFLGYINHHLLYRQIKVSLWLYGVKYWYLGVKYWYLGAKYYCISLLHYRAVFSQLPCTKFPYKHFRDWGIIDRNINIFVVLRNLCRFHWIVSPCLFYAPI